MAKIYTDKNGYKCYADSGKLVHRHVAEKKVGGKIGKGRVVHHKDGNKQNNKRENLHIMSRSEHSKLHASERAEANEGAGCATVFLGIMGIVSVWIWFLT